MPGSMAENARFLAGKVAEVGLCCFEAAPSAAMSEAELPAGLADLPLTWHVHLPTDLPAASGGDAARAALRVWERAAFLRPRLGVLHLPPPATGPDGPSGETWLRDFLRVWRGAGLDPALLALENVRDASPLAYKDALPGLGTSLCLDMGHAMAYGQEDVLGAEELMARVAVAHWSAPGTPGREGEPVDRHLPLTAWTPEQRRTADKAARLLPPGATHLVEVFRWDGVSQSWPVLRDVLQGRRE